MDPDSARSISRSVDCLQRQGKISDSFFRLNDTHRFAYSSEDTVLGCVGGLLSKASRLRPSGEEKIKQRPQPSASVMLVTQTRSDRLARRTPSCGNLGLFNAIMLHVTAV